MSKKHDKDNKGKKSNDKRTVPVKVVNDSLNVAVTTKPYLVTVFEAKEVSPGSTVQGPLGGLDLTGYGEYRLTLHFAGTENTPFSIQEAFGPAGSVDQMVFEVGRGQVGPKGIMNYRARFDIFGPKNLFIQVTNDGEQPFMIDGSLYAVR